ncbi:uncharacterized protein LOC143433235 isoform X2 [Xylocopa sonorina]|uniref:uncharacterized protein LOC143433235 isoform X2 n=1 Tax=Xylocopa sonorina TaxID=1818115 RepID=UPI00403AC4C8
MIASLPIQNGGGGGSGGGGGGGPTTSSRVARGFTLHRSNSSLELPHGPDTVCRASETSLRREYGSHGSIDVVAQSVTIGENLFAMLQDLRPSSSTAATTTTTTTMMTTATTMTTTTTTTTMTTTTTTTTITTTTTATDQQRNSVGAEYLRRVPDGQTVDADEVCGPTGNSSPKLRLKLQRLWGAKPTARSPMDESCAGPVVSADVEERQRRRAFAHYDCQSLTANLGYAAKLRGILLARRRNTATGASAASAFRASTPDETPEEDAGDGKGNELLESCPFFRNEVGGEGEREVGLTRSAGSRGNGVHRPSLSYGVAVLEPAPGETIWKHGCCPLLKRPLPIESVDEGAHYYRRYFLGREHQNWFGMDEQLGPVAISVRRDSSQYRIIIRTSELLTLRGSVPDEALGGIRPQGRLPIRELLELVAPEVQLGCLRLGTTAAEEALARLDEQGLSSRYKVGVLYCRSGQRTEEEMYNNQHAGPAFLEFLDTIGQRIRLRGFEGYKAGLDTRTDSTGTHAVAATHRGTEVTFHVSTMLPFTPNNRQQLLRKRHIGNDIVTIVFQEPGALPFSPRRIRSQFQHVFIVVRAVEPCSENARYTVAVSRSKDVPIFGPPVPIGATFTKGKPFADFILAKVINAENAAHRSEKFATMATRTRQEYLKDLASNYSSTTMVDTGQKFSMLSFSSKKKTAVRPRLSCDATQRGAICWQVILEDSNQNTDCYLGISVDTIVLIEEHSRQIVFVTPCLALLGWHAQTNSLRLYYHQGECVTIHVRGDYGERDELMEIVARLRAVTPGAAATELSLKRNSLGQLGFHVQPDGVVTQVESVGHSWQAGLRQGSRLVEICKVAVSTLSHDQMVDLLKTSAQVTVTVIPPNNDGNPRRGCAQQNCQYLSTNYEGDYENVRTSPDNTPTQQTAMSHQRRYERSFSPPRSSNSSGYGTGSSSRSFNDPRFPMEGTMTSSSSGHSSNDDRWYEILEPQDPQEGTGLGTNGGGTPPPPLPARQSYQMIAPKSSSQRKEKESRYANSNKYSENSKHHHAHEHFAKDAARHESGHGHRGQDHVSSSYVKLQKERYETKQESLYASQRELHKNEVHYVAHQKLSTSNSLPLAQNTSYSLPKSNLVGISLARGCNEYEHEGKPGERNSKYDAQDDKVTLDRASSVKYEQQDVAMRGHHEKRSSAVINYEYPEEVYERRNSKYDMDIAKYEIECQHVEQNRESTNRYELLPHEFKLGEKVTCLKATIGERPLPHKINVEYRQTKEFTASLPPEVRIGDLNGQDTRTTTTTLPSEDELSNGSGSVSPRLRRASKHRAGNLTPSSGSSRNQSPRPKPGVRNSHRNSANLTSSTLQEDLMRLINPDYIADDDQTTTINNNLVAGNAFITNQNPHKINNNILEIQNRCRSRENLCGSSSGNPLTVLPTNGQENGNATGSEVILTMARPATVISNASTASSPAPSENKLSKEERNSVSDLQSHLSTLELRVARETRRRLSLEDEVRRLRDENRRLQDESHAAAQQLRRFTEWFFQTIDHQ